MNFRTQSARKKLFVICCTLSIICIGFVYTSNAVIQNSTALLIFDDTQAIPHNKVGLVLGTSPYLKNGSPNPYFSYRIIATAKLYHSQKIDFILVSGDNGQREYNEPEAFRKALVKQDIPPEKIYLDYAGFRTLDSVIRAKAVFGQEKFTIISQKFHNERAIYIAQKNGIDAIGYNAQDLPTHLGFKTLAREYLARTKVFIDLLFGVSPKFLGEKIEIT